MYPFEAFVLGPIHRPRSLPLSTLAGLICFAVVASGVGFAEGHNTSVLNVGSPVATAVAGEHVNGTIATVRLEMLPIEATYWLKAPDGTMIGPGHYMDGGIADFRDVPVDKAGTWFVQDGLTGVTISTFTTGESVASDPTIAVNQPLPVTDTTVLAATVYPPKRSISTTCCEPHEVGDVGSWVLVRVRYQFSDNMNGWVQMDSDSETEVAWCTCAGLLHPTTRKYGPFRAGDDFEIWTRALWFPDDAYRIAFGYYNADTDTTDGWARWIATV